LTDLGEHLGGLGGKKEEGLDGSEDNEGNSLFSARPLLLLPLLHKLALPLKLLAKLGLWLLAPLSLVLLGGALTVGVCVFTPICTLKLVGFGFTRDSVRTFINQDRYCDIFMLFIPCNDNGQLIIHKQMRNLVFAVILH
jgi:hypothetical protein